MSINNWIASGYDLVRPVSIYFAFAIRTITSKNLKRFNESDGV